MLCSGCFRGTESTASQVEESSMALMAKVQVGKLRF